MPFIRKYFRVQFRIAAGDGRTVEETVPHKDINRFRPSHFHQTILRVFPFVSVHNIEVISKIEIDEETYYSELVSRKKIS